MLSLFSGASRCPDPGWRSPCHREGGAARAREAQFSEKSLKMSRATRSFVGDKGAGCSFHFLKSHAPIFLHFRKHAEHRNHGGQDRLSREAVSADGMQAAERALDLVRPCRGP